jgi:hypothetical protein
MRPVGFRRVRGLIFSTAVAFGAATDDSGSSVPGVIRSRWGQLLPLATWLPWSLRFGDPGALPPNCRTSSPHLAVPSGRTRPRLTGSTPGTNANLMVFTEPAVDGQIERISRLPIDQQPAAWGSLDNPIITKYYPLIVTGYGRVALLHGSRIGGMHVDNIHEEPTWQDMYVTR